MATIGKEIVPGIIDTGETTWGQQITQCTACGWNLSVKDSGFSVSLTNVSVKPGVLLHAVQAVFLSQPRNWEVVSPMTLMDRAESGWCELEHHGSFCHYRKQSKALKVQAAHSMQWQEQQCHCRLCTQMLSREPEKRRELNAEWSAYLHPNFAGLECWNIDWLVGEY